MYNYYIINTVVTFEQETVSSADVVERIAGVHQAGLPWLVAELADGPPAESAAAPADGPSQQAPPELAPETSSPELVGYAYATGWKSRPAYRYTTEVSVYVAPGREGLGVGSALYGRLLPEIASLGIHVALGGITLPNIGSVALHEKFGFHKVAHLEEVGFKFGRWIDVGYWQRTL
ncbi:MAG: N-acetyltransferase family protein [Spirochaetaceae bacterium]|nr:MAG: N-acetyltransferase family protein [Spirochaetaceae bacterium]